MTRKFDRVESFDERSRAYGISDVALTAPQSVVWPCADGDCLVTFDDMASLLADGGEACFPLKGAAANKTLVHKLAALFGCR